MKLTCAGCRTDFDVAEGGDLSETLCPTCHIPAAQSLPYAKTALVAASTAPTRADGAERREAKIPSRIGKYEILAKAGAGGMGVVYKARHTELNRVVALKVMVAGEHAAEDTLDRFQREARAAAALQHPNIVSVFDVGQEPPLYYIVMEYVDGPSLDDLVFDPGLKPEEAARMARDLARALQYAHEQNIVHRDIKPGNILVDRHGTPKLVDFGLAKSLADDKTLTKTGEIIGTACYMPPEQASGSMKSVDTKSDIYALGAVLYFMLTKRPPFSGDTLMAIIKQVETSDAPPPSALAPDVPRDLETICLKALSKEKPRRYATAADFARDLQRFLDGAPIEARPSSVFYRATKWSRRHPALSTALVMSALAAVVIGPLLYRNAQLQQAGPAAARAAEILARLMGGDDSARRLAEAQIHYEFARYEIEEKAAKYRAGARKERRQVLEKAVRELDEAVRIYPACADAHYLRGVALQALARTAAARQDFDRAIDLNPRHADAYYARVLLRLRSLRERRMRAQFDADDPGGLFREERGLVRKDIETLKTLGLKKEKALVAEARFAQVFGDFEKAASLADEALGENPAFADALVVRASIKRERAWNPKPDPARLREALADCNAAIESEVNNPEAYRVRAEVRLALDRYEEALRDLAEMESIAPDEPQTWIDKALVLEQDPFPARSTEEIARAIDRALELDPKNTTARFRRAALTLESAERPRDKFLRARADLDVALEGDPGFPMARILRMVCDLGLGEISELEKDLDAYLRTLPAGSKEQQERIRNGLRALIHYLRQRYEIPETEAIANEGLSLLKRQRYAESEAKYREVLRRIDDPRVVESEKLGVDQCRRLRTIAHYNLACLYSLQGDANRGIEELERALASGYSNFDHLIEDRDLDAVRAHPGFEELVKRYRR